MTRCAVPQAEVRFSGLFCDDSGPRIDTKCQHAVTVQIALRQESGVRPARVQGGRRRWGWDRGGGVGGDLQCTLYPEELAMSSMSGATGEGGAMAPGLLSKETDGQKGR